LKNLFLLFAFLLILGCGEKTEEKNRIIAVSAITSDMGCENCGMNLKKFINTNHAVKMKAGQSHFFCSINCSTNAWDSLSTGADSIFAVDFNSTKFVNVQEAHYVIGSSLRGTMTSISKFAFGSIDDAQSFSKTFGGKEIADYQTAFRMSKEEIQSRRK